MTETTKPVVTQADEEQLKRVAKTVHEALSLADVVTYLDMPLDTAEQVARLVLRRHRLAHSSQAVVSQDLVPVANKDSALPSDRATHEPSPDGLGHSVSVPSASVADISDDDLMRRAVANCRPRRSRGFQPRWVGVSDTFGLGSTYSHQLCRRFGLNPDEKVKR